MPSWPKEALDYIAAEGRVIRDAPVAFSVFVLLAALALWGALSWKFDAQVSSRDSIIASRDATINFQNGLIAEYKSRVQLPEPGVARTLTPEQRRILAQLKLKSGEFKRLVLVYTDEDEPRKYSKQFIGIANSIDLPVVQHALSGTLTSDVGLYVLIDNIAQPSDSAKNVIELLTKSYLNAHFYARSIQRSPEEEDSTFALYIAKTPW